MLFQLSKHRVNDDCTTRRRGAVIVFVALILPILVLILGFSIDLAHMQRVRTELRAVTDLAAKAAAEELSESSSPGPAAMAAAVAEGQAVAEANFVAGERLTLDAADFVFGRSAEQTDGTWLFTAGLTPPNAVRVNGRRTTGSPDGSIGLFFGFLYGRPHFETAFTATASFKLVDICLVLDRSSSMKLAVADTAGGMSSGDPRQCVSPWPDSRWVALDNAVTAFMNRMNSSAAVEHCALVTFASDYTSPCGESNSDASVDQDLTGNLPLISSAMTARSTSVWNGNTNIDAGINLGSLVLVGPSARPLAEKIMIVFTDGVYTGSNPVPAATSANAQGITVHTITFGDGANQADMQAVATVGQGQHFHAPDAATLNQVFSDLAGAVAILTE